MKGLGANLKAARLRSGKTLAEVSGLVGGHCHTWLDKIERDEREITLPDLLAAARVLDTDLGTLLKGTGVHEEEFGCIAPVPALTDLDGPWNVAGALSALWVISREEDDMGDKKFITAKGANLAFSAEQMLRAPEVIDASRIAGRRVTHPMVDTVELLTVQLRAIDNQIGGPRVTYREPLRYVHTLLEGTYDDGVGRRLYQVAAELLRLCGWVAYDSEKHARAQRDWVAGLKMAKVAGDTGMGAHIVASMAGLASKSGQAPAAVSLSETAMEHYSGASPKVLARLHLQTAKAYASVRRTNDTLRELSMAEDQVSRFDAPGTPEWASWLDEGVVSSDVGWCLARLGQHRRGIEQIQRGITLHQEFPRDVALFQARLAVAAMSMKKPDLDLATAAANDAMDLLEGQVTSPRCVGEISDYARLAASHWRHPETKHTVARAKSLAS